MVPDVRQLLAVAAVLAGATLSAVSQDAPRPPAAAKRTAQEDHRQLLKQLGIKSLRPGANGMDPKAANAANYDESKATLYPALPDPLVFESGEPVRTADDWWSRRRPEIVELFDREIYGRLPAATPAVAWKVVETIEETNEDVTAETRRLVGTVDNAACPSITVEIQMTLSLPKGVKGPVPAVLEFGFGGPPPGAPRRNDRPAGPPWKWQVLEQGWAFAVIVPTSVQADNGGGLTAGIIGLCNGGQPRKPDDWGALRAWAWGASRALDYLETVPEVDAKRVAIEGLSRYGKAALVTIAYDDRFAVGFIGSSGAGGAKLLRRNFGELVENLAGSGEYHWMAGNFVKYAGPKTWDELPVDAHELIALCAPRPLFISYGASEGPGAEGQWVDQRGSFLAAVAAGPVYSLLGRRGLETDQYPAVETALLDGEIAWRQHRGGHTTGPNWPTFFEFAGRYFSDPHP